MELLTALGLAGKFISDKNKSNDEPIASNKIKTSRTVGDNIYSSNDSKKHFKNMQKITDANYALAKDPKKTGVIPDYYNTLQSIPKKLQIREDFNDNDSVFSDQGSNDNDSMASNMTSGSVQNNHMALLNRAQKLKNNQYFENKIVPNNVSTFKEQFDDMTYDTAKPMSANNSKTNQISRDLEIKGGFSKYNDSDMTYGLTKKEQFVHNNMVPFVGGSKTYGASDIAENQMNSFKSRKMELFSGSANNVDYRPKTERKPLFNPLVGLTNIYGMPNMTDFQESRYIPSKERRNEKPMQPVRVTPGLNLGFNQVGKGGYQDPYRYKPKDIDELRPLNKQQKTHTLPNVRGLISEHGPVAVAVAKRKPDTFFELDAPVNKHGEQRAQIVTGDYLVESTARDETSREHFGAAQLNTNLPTPESLIAKAKVSAKENWNTDRAGGAGAYYTDANRGNAFDMITGIPDINARNLSVNTDRAGQGMGNSNNNNRGHAYDMVSNIPDQTLRNIYDLTDRAGQGMGNSNNNNKGYAYDMVTNVPDQNMRNIYDQTDRAGQGMGNTNNNNKGYAYDMVTNIPDQTMRNVYDQTDRAGQGMGNTNNNKNYVYDMVTNIPDQNMRNVYDQTDRAGQGMGNTENNKNYVYDMFTNIPDENMRNIYDQTDRAGQGVGNTENNKNYVYDMFTNIPDENMRNVHNQPDRAGQSVGNTENNKNYVFDMFTNIPDSNMRNVHDQSDRAGQGFGASQYEKGYVYDEKNMIPDSNMRNVHNQSDRAGQTIGTAQYNKNYVLDEKNAIPDANMRNIHSQTDRAGQGFGASQYEKGYVYDEKNYIPDQNMRNIHNQSDRAGQGFGASQYNRNYVLDEKNAIPDQTMRNIHENTDRNGHVGNNSYYKGYVLDEKNAIPDPTMRQMYENADRAGSAGAGNGTAQFNSYVLDEKNARPDSTMRQIHENADRAGQAGAGNSSAQFKSYVLDEKNARPDPTMRQMYENADRAGQAGIGNAGAQFNSYVLDEKGAIPDPTMRQIHENRTYVNPLNSVDGKKQTNRHDASNQLLSNNKTTMGRKPTNANYEKGPTMEYTIVKLCEPVQINRELYPDIRWENQEVMPTTYTRIPHELPNDEFRFYSYVKDNLEGNPYINNLQHKATYPLHK